MVKNIPSDFLKVARKLLAKHFAPPPKNIAFTKKITFPYKRNSLNLRSPYWIQIINALKQPYFRILLLVISFVTLAAAPLSAQFYYGLRQEFGKNRLQYTEFDWVFYRFERYDIYFYRGNDKLATQVARFTDADLPRIESILDAPLDDRLQILVFNNLSDLKQSNVNANSEDAYNTGGVTRISGRRLFLYFNGDYNHLQEQLRSGLTEVVLSNLIYGNFAESIKNSTLLNLPEWYTEGLISYMGKPWSVEVDTKVRDGFLTGKYKRFNSLTGEDAVYAGHSMWFYLVQTYGRTVLKNVVFMAIVNRNIESGFLYVLGKDLDEINKGWKEFYEKRYANFKIDKKDFEKGAIKVRKNHQIVRMEGSPDGKYIAYVDQVFGEYKLYLYDIERDKKKRIVKDGYKIAQNTDKSYPILAWHPNGEILTFFTEEKGFTYINFYNLKDKKREKKPFFKFDKILSFEYAKDGKRLVISASKNGQSDIFLYTILNTKVEQLTNDSYNDLLPSFFAGDSKVVWSSNRVTDTLKQKELAMKFPRSEHDLFAMEAKEPKDTSVLMRLTNTPGIDEVKATEYANGYIGFLSNRSGTQNRHLIKIDSAIAYVDTVTHYEYLFSEYQVSNAKRNIVDVIYDAEKGNIYDMELVKKRYRVYQSPYLSPNELGLQPVAEERQSPNPVPEQKLVEGSGNTSQYPLFYPGPEYLNFEVNIDDYDFGTDEPERPSRKDKAKGEKSVSPLPEPSELVVEQAIEEEPLEIPPKRNYFLSFYKDDFTVRFDNIFENPQYQRFTGFVSGDLLNSGFNMQFKAGVLDLMHNYQITGGLRTNFQPLAGTSIAPNAEFYIGVGDYKDRLDKQYTYYRRSQLLITQLGDFDRIITNEVSAKYTWPFNPVTSFRGSVAYRNDKTTSLSREQISLEDNSFTTDYAILRAAYVFDNTRKLGLNLYAGTRYKVFTEYYRNLSKSNSGLHTAGVDFRNYTIIHRNFIWANRFAAGTSFGQEKLIYIMGGVDNVFVPRFEPTTPIAQNENYIFQTLVTNMRGFFQNKRNGNNFAVINSELRFPIFSYLLNRPIKSDFIKNFQLIGFADIGTAWNGDSPYDPVNAINTRTINRGNLTIVLDSQKEPIIAGVGPGIRTRLFGYFLRFDYAWGIEDGRVLDPLFYFSISTDF